MSDGFGNANNAYLFNGTTNYMQVPNSASLNPNNITLMAIFWVNDYYQGLCHVNQVFGKGTPDNINGFYALRFSDFVVNSTQLLNTNNDYVLGAFRVLEELLIHPRLKQGSGTISYLLMMATMPHSI